MSTVQFYSKLYAYCRASRTIYTANESISQRLINGLKTRERAILTVVSRRLYLEILINYAIGLILLDRFILTM